MAFTSKSTLMGTGPTVPYDTGDAPGYPAGTKFITDGEEAIGELFNRPLEALAENTDVLYSDLSDNKAYIEVAALAAFSGNSVDIDPSGGAAGDINYSGLLYLGEGSWSGQEFYDTLFQILDEDYNEVLVDSVEAKVTSLTGNSIGDSFVSTITTLNLNVTLPSDNYRIVYARGVPLGSLPAYALVRSDVRGVQELPTESGRRSVYVLDANSSAPADYSGTSALEDALTALGDNITLYLRPGTYNLTSTNSWNAGKTNVRIIGETNASGGGSGVTLYALSAVTRIETIGDDWHFENIRFDKQFAAEYEFWVSGDNISFVNCVFVDGYLWIRSTANNTYIRGGSTGGDDRALYIQGNHCTIENLQILTPSSPTTGQSIVAIAGSGVHMKNVSIDGGTASMYCMRFYEASYNHIFENVHVTNDNAYSIVQMDSDVDPYDMITFIGCSFTNANTTGGKALHIVTGSDLLHLEFMNCRFSSYEKIMDINVNGVGSEIRFRGCYFNNTNTTWYDGHFALVTSSNGSKLVFESCQFIDVFSKGVTTATDPGTTSVPSSLEAVLDFTESILRDITLDRGGLTYDVQDAPWIKLTDCFVENLYVKYDCGAGNVFSFNSDSDGFIEVLNNSTLKNLIVDGPLGQGCDATNGWSRPLLFIEGMTPYGITSGARSGGRAIVDGVELIQATTDDWYGSVALFARLNGMATLRRFTFGDRNILSIPTGLNKTQGILFYLNDTGENILEDCFVSIEDTTTYGGLVERVVYAEGTNDIIRNNRIYLASASTIGILQAISVDDDFVLVENNYVHNLSGSFTASTYAIYGSSQAQFLRFISNYVYTATCTASQPLIYLNRSDSQLTVVTSNILYSADANAPTIGTAGGTPVGNTDNVLA